MIFLSTAWQAAQPSFFIIASAAAMSSAACALPMTSTSDAIPAKASFIVPLPDQLEKTRSDGTRKRGLRREQRAASRGPSDAGDASKCESTYEADRQYT